MLSDLNIVFLLIVAAAALMASNRLRFDVVALLVVVTLMLTGILSATEALSGFGSPVVMLVACLLVIGDMLDRTGVAAAIGNWILRKGGSNEIRLCVIIMASTGILGAVMSSTAVVAIFIPIILRIARETDIRASSLLMPMSYAALISGMLTLIATTPNLVVSEELKAAGYSAFGFFSFTPVGLAVLAVGIAYILLVGRRLLPQQSDQDSATQYSRSVFDFWRDYRNSRDLHSCTVELTSPLVNRSIADMTLHSSYSVRVIGIIRGGRRGSEKVLLPPPDAVVHAGDALLLIAESADFERFAQDLSLSPYTPKEEERQRWLWELGASTMLIHPESPQLGKTVVEAAFRDRYNLYVVGVRRDGEAIPDFEETRLRSSDSLLVLGPWSTIKKLPSEHHDFVQMETAVEQAHIVPEYRRASIALVILSTMVLLSVFDVVPLVAAVLMAALAAVFSRCMSMEDAYRSIHWSSLVLVAGMLPLADALEKTGGTALIVDTLMGAMGTAGPSSMLTVLFFLTAGIGLFLSNTASAVLVAPIAIAAAESLGVSPYPFAVAVLIAASAAFVTPVSTPVVTLVVEPGRYQFMDFVRVGVPLLILTWLTTLLVVPMFFPYKIF